MKKIIRILFLTILLNLSAILLNSCGKTVNSVQNDLPIQADRGDLPGQTRPDSAGEDENLSRLRADYRDYRARFDKLGNISALEGNHFAPVEQQSFPVILESFGEAEVTCMAVRDEISCRFAIIIADDEGEILYKTDDLLANCLVPGELRQPEAEFAAMAFADVSADGKTDVILLTRSVEGADGGVWYNTGDVLFQGERDFYRDWRISDKINRFSMNKNANCIISYLRDGRSTEFLYTADTEAELMEHGFSVIEEQCYTRNFEKLGKLKVLPGTYRISEYNIFMIYLINERGDIVWSFQPMERYDNLYSLKGITGRDMDGDGMKDLVVLARYSYENADGGIVTENACAIYYQRTGGFEKDEGFVQGYRCSEDEKMETLVEKIREYWGWRVEETEGKEKTDDKNFNR